MNDMDKAYENLANGIIKQACVDYADAYMGETVDHKAPEDTMAEIDKFMHSDWYHQMTNVNGDYLMNRVMVDTLDKHITCLKRAISEPARFKISIRSDKKNGIDPMSYMIPPVLHKGLFKVIEDCIADLEKERARLSNEDYNQHV